MEGIESKCLDQANKRLKGYIEQLNEHIIKIVESEADEFLSVAGKLDSFRHVLTDLKDASKDFQRRFGVEKDNTVKIFRYLGQRYEELQTLISEKEKLIRLIQVQESYSGLESKVKEFPKEGLRDSYIELEECARVLVELKSNSNNSQVDYTFNHQVTLLERQLLAKSNQAFFEFIHKSGYFSQ